jgi:putative aldouronate transport system substrate-binding protein
MKRTYAFILISVILTILASCGQGGQPNSGFPEETPPVIVSVQPKENSDFIPAEAEGGVFKLPIAEEAASFSIFTSYDPSSYNMADNNSSIAYIEAEKRTGIHIEWTHYPEENAQYEFMTSVSAGKYSDAYMVPASLMGLPDRFVGNLFIDLEPYIPQFAPNYDHLRKTLGVTAETKTLTGRAAGFLQLLARNSITEFGPFGRSDWLKELGLDMPYTYDELHDVLVAFRDRYSPEAPLAITNNGIDDWLLAGFDTMIYDNDRMNAFIVKDGKVALGALQPGAKEFAETMAKWYSEGLIDRDFMARDIAPAADTVLVFDGDVGIGKTSMTDAKDLLYQAELYGFKDTDGFEFKAFPIPVRNKGDVRKITVSGTNPKPLTDIMNCISMSCATPEQFIKWFDYFYTEEGSLLANYGVINESYTLDANGNAQMKENLFGEFDMREAVLSKYAMNSLQACLYDPLREYSPKDWENMLHAADVFDSNWQDEYTLPASVTMTENETREYAIIMLDVGKYLEETFVGFMTGTIPMSEYDAKMQTLDKMNYKRAEELMQKAYDRYLQLSK